MMGGNRLKLDAGGRKYSRAARGARWEAGCGRVIGADVSTDEGWETAGNVLESALIPIALSSVFVIGLATWLRWWPQIIHEPLPVQRWVRIVPIALLVAALVGTSWGNRFDQKATLVLVLILDFVILSGQIGVDPESSPLSLIVIVTMIGLGILLWRRRHRIEAES